MALLLWSGGCDSTALLCDMLSDAPKWVAYEDRKLNPVRTLAINHPQVPCGTQGRAAREKVLKELRRRGHKIDHTELKITHDGAFEAVSHYGCIQPAFWLTNATPFLLESEHLYTGWVRGDDVWHHRDAVSGAFGWCRSLLNFRGDLVTPLEWVTKPEVILALKANGLYGKTWYCEAAPDAKPCKTCTPCQTHRTALWRIEQGFVP